MTIRAPILTVVIVSLITISCYLLFLLICGGISMDSRLIADRLRDERSYPTSLIPF